MNSAKVMNRAMQRSRICSAREGFTLVEMLIVMIIFGALLTFAIPSFTQLSKGRNAQNARDALVWMATRARARAIERGEVQLLKIDPANERVSIVWRRTTGAAAATDTLEAVNFATVHNATISTTANTVIILCYSPRGFAFVCDGALSPTVDTNVDFSHGGKTATARVKILGQIERI
jgi:prepilin-type N-terminal cleavage/methylation domain-containing protein